MTQSDTAAPINPCIDFAFKKLFGSEENADLLIALINAILQLPSPITKVTIKNPYSISDYRSDKLSILDIKAQDQNGQWFNIEMQMAKDPVYDKRALYYWCKILTEQLQQGDLYEKLAKTFSINLLGFNLISTTTQVHNRYRILNLDTFQDDNKHNLLELHYLELEKFKKSYTELSTALDRWLAFFTSAQDLSIDNQLPPTLRTDPFVIKALDITKRLFNEEERKLYELRLQLIRDESSRMDSAIAQGRAEGLAEGLIKGHEVGLAEGQEIGLAKGQEIGLAKGQLTLLKNLLTRKFGKLSKFALEKLDTATPDQLEVWAEQIFDARSVEELLR